MILGVGDCVSGRGRHPQVPVSVVDGYMYVLVWWVDLYIGIHVSVVDGYLYVCASVTDGCVH